MSSEWINFVKNYAEKNGLKYREALSKAGEEYKKRNDPPKVEEVKKEEKIKKVKDKKVVEKVVEPLKVETVKTKRAYNKKEKIEVNLQ